VDGRDQLITLSVQSVDFAVLRSHLQQPRSVAISGRTAYCGQYGQAMLYLPLGTRRVLSIAAPCPLASEFAAGAMKRLAR
jgi:hypothetical protein